MLSWSLINIKKLSLETLIRSKSELGLTSEGAFFMESENGDEFDFHFAYHQFDTMKTRRQEHWSKTSYKKDFVHWLKEYQ